MKTNNISGFVKGSGDKTGDMLHVQLAGWVVGHGGDVVLGFLIIISHFCFGGAPLSWCLLACSSRFSIFLLADLIIILLFVDGSLHGSCF